VAGRAFDHVEALVDLGDGGSRREVVSERLQHRDPVGVDAGPGLGHLRTEDAAAAHRQHDVGERDLGVELLDADRAGDGAHHLADAQPARPGTEHERAGPQDHVRAADQVQRLEPVLVLVLVDLLLIHHANHATGGGRRRTARVRRSVRMGRTRSSRSEDPNQAGSGDWTAEPLANQRGVPVAGSRSVRQ
jgi:hypothetical protein